MSTYPQHVELVGGHIPCTSLRPHHHHRPKPFLTKPNLTSPLAQPLALLQAESAIAAAHGGVSLEEFKTVVPKLLGTTPPDSARIVIEAFNLPITPEQYLAERNERTKELFPKVSSHRSRLGAHDLCICVSGFNPPSERLHDRRRTVSLQYSNQRADYTTRTRSFQSSRRKRNRRP
jgi:hypothetical protein